MLLDEQAGRTRWLALLDGATAARAGQATKSDFENFLRELKRELK